MYKFNYAKKFSIAFTMGRINYPSAWDCKYCNFVVYNSEHIEYHIIDNYYVPSLLLNAIISYPVSKSTLEYIKETWKSGNKEYNAATIKIAQYQIEQSIFKYISQE